MDHDRELTCEVAIYELGNAYATADEAFRALIRRFGLGTRPEETPPSPRRGLRGRMRRRARGLAAKPLF